MVEIYQYTIFILLAPLGALVSLLVASVSWRERQSPGAISLAWLTIGVAGWLLSNTAELVAHEPEGTLFFARLTYIFIAIVPVFWLKFAVEYSGRQSWFTSAIFLTLFIIPTITILLVWSNDVHGMVWRNYHFIPSGSVLALQVLKYGPWFWVHIGYSYFMFLLGTAMIAGRYFRSSGLFRKQSNGLVISAILPLIINLIYITRLDPFGITKDYTPIFLAFSGVSFMVGFLRYRLFDIVPVPRERVLDYMNDGVLVIDQKERLVDINRQAQRILDCENENLIGQKIEEVLPVWAQFQNQKASPDKQNGRPKNKKPTPDHMMSLCNQFGQRHYEIRATPFSYSRQVSNFQVIIVHDITERINLLKQLEHMARVDYLTELYNRRHFLELAWVEYEKARRYKHPLSILMFDIDQFKKVNDAYGHAVGDEVLRGVAFNLKSQLRAGDVLARYGGEEFIILLPETTEEEGLEVAERLRLGVEHLAVETDDGSISVTISVGAAGLDKDFDLPFDKLLVRSDMALYRAKQAGRNRACV